MLSDRVLKVDAVLGMAFINLFEELRIYPKEILRLPSFQIEVGKVPVELKNLMVEIADYDTPPYRTRWVISEWT